MNRLNLRFRWTDENGKEQTFERGNQYLVSFLRRGLLLATGHSHESHVEGNIEDYLEIVECDVCGGSPARPEEVEFRGETKTLNLCEKCVKEDDL